MPGCSYSNKSNTPIHDSIIIFIIKDNQIYVYPTFHLLQLLSIQWNSLVNTKMYRK